MLHHHHYSRHLVYQPETPQENVHPDSRVKLLLRLPSPYPDALIEPQLWHRLGVSVLPSILGRLPTPHIYLQTGPTCGLYALKMIAPWLNVTEVLSSAVRQNMTLSGEMFCAHEWAHLASQYGLNGTVLPVDQIGTNMLADPNAVAVIPYDADMSGISYRQGRNAHWCVVWSVWQVQDELLALTTNSSCVLPSIERWSELEASNRQLKWAMVRVNPEIADYIDARCLNGLGVLIR